MPVTVEKYEATVSAIDGFDDEFLNRGVIEVLCPGLMGDNETPLPVLCEPVHDWSWFYVPDVGEAVEIEVTTTSDRDETWGQQGLEALAPVWRGKRYHTDIETDGEDPRPIHDDFIALNYGKRRGFATPFGHVLLFDDTEGDQRIYLTHMAKQLEPGVAPKPENFTRIEIEPDGSLLASFLNKHKLHFTTKIGNLKVSLDGVNPDDDHKHTLEFDAGTPKLVVSLAKADSVLTLDGAVPSFEVTMKAANHVVKLVDGNWNVKTKGGTAIDVAGDDANTVATFGDGVAHATIVEKMEALWGAMVAYADGHTHLYDKIAVSGGSGAPAVGVPVPTETAPPSQPATVWNAAINSTHLAYPDG